jgi:molybdopterin converting factor small subunit
MTGPGRAPAARGAGSASVAGRPTATIEVTTWVTKYVGGDGAGTRVFEESITPDETVRTVLLRYSARFPDLDAALWDESRTALGPHIEVLVNNAVLGVTHDLDTSLIGGERITLLGQFMGG